MSLAEDRRARLLRSLTRTGTARLADLAAELDVSIATVRRDAETLHRRGRLVRRHGAVELLPQSAGRRSPRPATIGMMHSDNRYLALIAHAARREAERRDHRFLIEPVESQDDAARAAERLVAAGCIGMIYAPQWRSEAETAEPTPWLDRLELPVVLGGRDVDADHHLFRLDSVIADHAYGMRLGLDHLQSLGHRRIVATIHDESPPGRLLRTYFVDQLRRRDLPQLTPPLLTPPERTAAALAPIVDAMITTRATAIVVHTDSTAQALVPRLRAAGLRVPADVSVVAYDDIVAPEVDLALTSISPAKHELGIEAVSLLLRRHRLTRAGLDPPPVAHVRLLPVLVVRTSTGPAGRLR
ncbi:LacI family DNA-binding transcriptional regulator [Microlunatus speluncae]|uniref:LacI family DNA-binding transcriptional regulator n=1 Tax=Microlunatus speluncae TaxID=2594267 RepID=UPI0012660A0A|nr:LacI family DNA-binding transcriptional regulator [Microlunatus speluncae]